MSIDEIRERATAFGTYVVKPLKWVRRSEHEWTADTFYDSYTVLRTHYDDENPKRIVLQYAHDNRGDFVSLEVPSFKEGKAIAEGEHQQRMRADLIRVDPCPELIAEVERLRNPSGGDIEAQAMAWHAVWKALESIGLLSFLGSMSGGRVRAVEFIEHLGREVERLRAVEAAAKQFVEPMRRYRKHVMWLKGDEDLLIAAAEALDAALKQGAQA